MSFKSKVIIVTGASSGIGAAVAVAFAKEGAIVVIVGRNDEKLAKVAKQCVSSGGTPLVIKSDVTKDAESIISITIEKFKKIDILINNAGILRTSSLLDGNIMNIYEHVMNTNIKSVVNMTSQAAPHLIASKGNVVNISSVAGKLLGTYRFTIYAISKAAMDIFTKGAALELGQQGVRVNTVSPGPVRTDIFDNAGLDSPEDFKIQTILNRCSDSEEIADLVLFLASDKAKGVTGSDYVVDNGYLLTK
ncbi:3-oxoacyl-[acyl-carrier-protein] reductase FabG-like [Leptidea sinapis]|uniref:3-oxoacyl-[acyl-carrier-protein] reductase FabG-like n=1 Tax=Leptidea sinapis TaxID=189913 RepID=UPI0021462B42|nr:3-oxoacyl-[acyl-carrier-protein] reductase FabG-like [Leptidea sinapis]